MSTLLSHLGLLEISGEGAKKLLQGQLTCNFDEISATTSRLGAHCNPQGRILSLFRVMFHRENYYLQMPKNLLQDAEMALKKYAVFFKVNIHDVSDRFSCAVFTGRALNSFFAALPTQIDEMLCLNNIAIIKLPSTEDLYEIIGDSANIADIMTQLPPSMTSNDWRRYQIEAGIPTIYSSTGGKLLPHEINLQLINAVSFNKGCYTGQEIIARMHYRGQSKKRMVRARVNSFTQPEPGSDIFDNGPCGTIVDSCHETDNTYQLLVIANQTDIENQQLFLDAAKTQPIEFLTLPY